MKVFSKDNNIFNLLTEAISEGIIVVNEMQEIVATNGSSNDIFGYQEDELLGLQLNTLIPKRYHHNHKGHVENFARHSEKRKMARGRDLYGVRKDGTESFL